MFDFKEPEDGSEIRFHQRVSVWQEINPHGLPRAKHHFWWMLHNLVAHPAIGIAPSRTTFDFHDWTSRKLNGL
jgi:hypothetical protein